MARPIAMSQSKRSLRVESQQSFSGVEAVEVEGAVTAQEVSLAERCGARPTQRVPDRVRLAPSVQRDVCYTDGCDHLQGDGVTVAYSWVWVPAAPAPPPGPPSR